MKRGLIGLGLFVTALVSVLINLAPGPVWWMLIPCAPHGALLHSWFQVHGKDRPIIKALVLYTMFVIGTTALGLGLMWRMGL